MDLRKKRLLARLAGIQSALSRYNSTFLINLEKELLVEYNNVVFQERVLLAQKARVERAKMGDMNSKYFHTLTKVRNCRKKIVCLKDHRGEWVTSREDLKKMMVDHYNQIFTTSHYEESSEGQFQSTVRVSEEDYHNLALRIEEGEVTTAIAQMSPMKCPGPDGIQALFFKNFREHVGPSVVDLVSKAFLSSKIPKGINDSFLALISKVDPPSECKDFRPIGLCNTIYKILTKVIAKRIKPLWSNLIHPSQTSFIPGRVIHENVIIAKEMAHFFKKCGKKKNVMDIKVDLSKAYDSLEWGFIKETLMGFNIPKALVDLIMDCICSPEILVIWNCDVTTSFRPLSGY